MNIFLTGATGFLGSHTAEELIRRGHSVTALVRKTSKIPSLSSHSLRWREGSLPLPASLNDFFQETDAVVHIAGVVKALSEKDFFQVNAAGTESLIQAILNSPRRPQKFIYVSTVAVHNPTKDGPNFCLPTSLCHPLSSYGRSKIAGEKALEALKGKVPTVILRPPVLYGPRDQEFLPLFQSIRWGLAPLLGSGKNELSVCYVEDVARALGDLVDNSLTTDEIFCLDDGSIQTWKSMAKTVSEVMGKKAFTLQIPKPLFKIGAGVRQTWAKIRGQPALFTLDKIKEMEQPRWVCGYKRLQDMLGWKPRVTLLEGMKKAYHYYRDSKLIP